MYKFVHFNFNVLDLEKSLRFYNEALDLKPVRTVDNEEFTLVYLGDGKTGFELELTYIKGREKPYDLGECEFHLAMTSPDMESSLEKHKKMDAVCFENKEMGIYFISDPDGYWIEIIPEKS